MDDPAVQTLLSAGLPMLQALVLSLLFSLLPGRLGRMKATNKGRETLKAQILICLAGAIMTTVIGTGDGATARAFALLGLGSFIRFRTAVKSPADTAILFVLIAIGMACGVGHALAAALATFFLMAIVGALELIWPSQKEKREKASTANESAIERIQESQ